MDHEAVKIQEWQWPFVIRWEEKIKGRIERWDWLERKKLRVVLIGGDTWEMIWRHIQDVHGELEEDTAIKATRVEELGRCSKSIS